MAEEIKSNRALDAWLAKQVTAGSKVPGGPAFVQCRGAASEPFFLGPYENPSLAKEDADRLREFVASLLRRCGVTGPEPAA